MIDLPVHRAFSDQLLRWFDAQHRDLPWRQTRDPYAIWVSEMMLQQTQVATVIPHWTRWMARFPTVQSLADGSLDEVLKQWQGLGYYARARNLHKAARAIVAQHNGVFPTRFADVLGLPGVGRYTAGAVCSIAFDQDVPLVDANVIRVLCRVFGLRGDPRSPAVQARLWELAQQLIPLGSARRFNQAMMELGALVCQATPRCHLCPVNDLCAAFASGNPTSLPERAPRPVFTRQTDVSAVIERGGAGDTQPLVLVVRRPEGGLWGGLWEFPRVTAGDGESVGAAAARAAREAVHLSVRVGEQIGVVKHGVTTRKITLIGVACALAPGDEPPAATAAPTCAWATLSELDRFALASPQVRLLEQMRARRAQPTLFG